MTEKKLTPKQERFVLAYMETGNASESYRKAYDAKQMTEKSVNETASRLLKNVKVAARLEALRAPVLEATQMTLEGHLQRLKELSDEAQENGKFGPAIQAEIARGKVSGFYVERVEMEATVMGLAERMRAQRGK